MNIYTPNYYHRFTCIASSCKHNCCIGWEIDIDDESIKKYSSVSGSFGKRLEENISEEGVPHFILAENERCPFLNEKNLCDIITELGEDHLCQICNDHPRFRNFFSGRTEIGLGLCCEEAARIILTEDEPFHLISENVTGPEEMTDAEETFFVIRDNIFGILTKREIPLHCRIKSVFDCLDIDPDCLMQYDFYDEFSQLEILDESWRDHLEKLRSYKGDEGFPFEKYEVAFENLLMYFIYRHLAGELDDGCLNERFSFCVLSAWVIYVISAVAHREQSSFCMEDLIEIVRMYSSEIEYSEENTEHLLDVLFEVV